ncbi:MAG: hypothetical protein F4107_03145 [Gemmatimonadetes bacterium]|nr:hypothetical protein [Gemmatimonadota bacterium]MYI64921.1 hypothetical protein [Gemmatimonadota bacterium]
MGSSHYFSIYLLKPAYNTSSALRDDHDLVPNVTADRLPQGASLYLSEKIPRQVWWKKYFGIDRDLKQAFKGALVFVPASERIFAFSFGRAYHSLKNASYEPDFGLRVTLNLVDANKIKNTDIVEPANARRRRTQVPVLSDLTIFDFDHDSSVLKSLAGKAKAAHEHLVRNVSGQDNLRISSDVEASNLPMLCEELLTYYESNDYENVFPGIRAISRVKDPFLIEQLEQKLVLGLRGSDPALLLGVPDFVDYARPFRIRYRGAGGKFVRDDVALELYYEYLLTRNVSPESIDLEDLQRHKIELVDEDMRPGDRHSIGKALIYDTHLEGDSAGYHLLEGVWYRVERDYMQVLQANIGDMFEDPELPPYTHEHEDEKDYNSKMEEEHCGALCLDGEDISPAGATQVEPCDFLCVEGTEDDGEPDVAFVHVKRSTRSSGLSHLFSQGTGAMELLLSESDSVERLEALVAEREERLGGVRLRERLEERTVRVVFAVVTRKDPSRTWRNLPLFSRINLRRAKRQFQLMGVPVRIGYIRNET